MTATHRKLRALSLAIILAGMATVLLAPKPAFARANCAGCANDCPAASCEGCTGSVVSCLTASCTEGGVQYTTAWLCGDY